MSPLQCSLCFQASITFPKVVKDVLLIEFIQKFNKFQSISDATDLGFCQSCWVNLMRFHQIDHQLSLKKELCDAKMTLLSPRIRRAQESLIDSGNNPQTWEELEDGILATENKEGNDVEVSGRTEEGEKQLTEAVSVDSIDSNSEAELVKATSSGGKEACVFEGCALTFSTRKLMWAHKNGKHKDRKCANCAKMFTVQKHGTHQRVCGAQQQKKKLANTCGNCGVVFATNKEKKSHVDKQVVLCTCNRLISYARQRRFHSQCANFKVNSCPSVPN